MRWRQATDSPLYFKGVPSASVAEATAKPKVPERMRERVVVEAFEGQWDSEHAGLE
jgi:hypothetical protein